MRGVDGEASMRFALWSLTCSLLVPALASAQTIVPAGDLPAVTTWTAAGSPYVVEGDVRVPTGGTLTIEAGAELRFATSDPTGGGADPSRVELVIDGTLLVTGTAAAPVLFRADGAIAPGSWYGIVIGADSPAATLEHAEIRHAYLGLRSMPADATTMLSDVHIEDASYGAVQAIDGALHAVRVSAESTFRGFFIGEGASAVIEQALIWNQTSDCIFIRQSDTTPMDSEIRSSTLHGCENGVSRFVSGSSARAVRVIDSIVTGQRDYGVEGGATFTYTLLWGNARASVGGGVGNRGGNPLYVSDPTNLRITSRSPARNAGSAGQDLGALPYMGDATPGLYGNLHEDLVLPAGDHVVEGDLTVRPGVTLTLLPGAHLSFAAGDIMGFGSLFDRGELIVEGALDAQGTRAMPIRMDVVTSTIDGWGGVFASAGSAVTLREVQIRYPRRGLVLSGPGTHDLDGIRVQDALWYGVHLLGGEHTVQRLHAINTVYGMRVEPLAAIHLLDALLENQEDGGVYLLQDLTTPTNSEIVHATIVGCDRGIYYSGSGTRRLRVRSSIITHGLGAAFSVSSSALPRFEVTYTNAWNNGFDHLPTLATAEGNVSVDPQYADPGADFHLAAGSPMVDAADPSGGVLRDLEGTVRPLDGDGDSDARPDMGAYELILMPECGNGFVESGEECDDGNASNDDECLVGCVAATCGDGFVWRVAEECDDGNTTSGDGCDASCAIEADVDGGSPDGGAGPLEGDAGMDAGLDPDAGPGGQGDGGAVIPAVDAGGTDAGGGGCGCRAAGHSPAGLPCWIALGLGALVRLRRRY